jgi:hypothetical protein
LLARRQGWRRAGAARTTVEFDLAAGDLDRDGLLVVELAEAAAPSWSADRISARSALGLRIDTISVRETAAPTAAAWHPTGCDLAVLPPGSPAQFRLDLTPVPQAPPLPRSPSTRFTRRRPPRAAFKLVRIARRVVVRAGSQALPDRPNGKLKVFAADLRNGKPTPVQIVNRRPGSLDLRLATPADGPVLVGLNEAHPGLSCRIVPHR